MKIKHKPEDFVVREAYRFEPQTKGAYYVYLLDKQKVSTMDAVRQIAQAAGVQIRDVSYCGLKDKQGRTEQLVAVKGKRVDFQTQQIRLKYLGRKKKPLSAENLTANRFVVTVRDLSIDEAVRVPASVQEVSALGVVNYFDSQRFGGVKHGQGFLAKDLAKGRIEHALKGLIATPSKLDHSADGRVKAFWARHWGEWTRTCKLPGAERYERVIRQLRRDPHDFEKAFMAVEKGRRGLVVFEFQSWLYNEAVRRYLLGRLGRKGHLVLRYQAGTHLFPRQVQDPARREALSQIMMPLPGPDTTFTDPEVEKAVMDTLDKERLTLEDLGFPQMEGMGMRHEERPMMVMPRRLSVVDPRPDEVHPGRIKLTLAFTLPPGAYATLVVRRVLWFATSNVRAFGGAIPDPDEGFVSPGLQKELQRRVSKAVHRKNRRPKPMRGITAEMVKAGVDPEDEDEIVAIRTRPPRGMGAPKDGSKRPAREGKPTRSSRPVKSSKPARPAKSSAKSSDKGSTQKKTRRGKRRAKPAATRHGGSKKSSKPPKA